MLFITEPVYSEAQQAFTNNDCKDPLGNQRNIDFYGVLFTDYPHKPL